MLSANDPKTVKKAAKVLNNGGIVVFPTETVYGVGALFSQEKAIEKIYLAKERTRSKPLLLHISSIKHLELAKEVPPIAFDLIENFWPGPLSIILKASNFLPKALVTEDGTIGLRMPSNDFFKKLADMVGPIAATSANKSSYPSPKNVGEAKIQLGNFVDLYVDGGEIKGGVPSTILDLTKSPPLVLRIGAVKISELERVIGKVTHS